MKKSKIFIWICFCFIIAVFIDSFFTHSVIKLPQLDNQVIDQEITWTGKIIQEPDQRVDKINLVVEDQELGKVLVTTELGANYHYGDVLKVTGTLLKPKVYDDFDYQQYLAKDKIYLVSYYPNIEVVAANQVNFFYAQILKFKKNLRQVIENTLLPPQSSILKALFLGDKQSLSDDLKERLNLTGTRHIVAISGMHLVIASQLLLYLLLGLGLWRQQVFYGVVVLLLGYVVMIGLPASAVRAFIFIFLLLLAQKVGRLRSADRAVVMAAALMLLINPLLLKSDVGFQLSFAATLGIIYLKPILDKWFGKLKNPWGLKDILTLTLAAQIAVLGLLIYHFSRLSLISPLANLLIVPLLPVLMILALIISLTGLIWLPLAKLLAWPAHLILTYVSKAVEYLSQIPLASYCIESFSWIYLATYYLILIIVIKRIRTSRVL